MRLEIMGPPGAGKGTQAQRIVAERKIPHLSTGDMFRDNVRRDTALGREAKAILARGELVPDALVSGMVDERLEQPDCRTGHLLDGFPRTAEQVRALDEMLDRRNWQRTAVLVIDVPRQDLLARLTSRRVCSGCGTVTSALMQAVDTCTNCGGTLEQRADDKEDVIEQRLEVYDKQTAPVLEIYRPRNILVPIDGVGTVDEIAGRIQQALEQVTV